MIGVVCGLASEARLWAGTGVRVRVSGADAARARGMAEAMLAGGVDALLSFGVAGGLEPGLGAGTLVVPEAVLGEGGRFAADAGLVARLAGLSGARVVELAAGVEAVAADRAGKAGLAARGAAVVDMETGAVAGAAARAGARWAALRAVSDDWRTELPGWVAGLVQADGRVNGWRAAAGVVAHPQDWGRLAAIARANARALRALERAVREVVERGGVIG